MQPRPWRGLLCLGFFLSRWLRHGTTRISRTVSEHAAPGDSRREHRETSRNDSCCALPRAGPHCRPRTPLGFSPRKFSQFYRRRIVLRYVHGTAWEGNDRQGNGACRGNTAGPFNIRFVPAIRILIVSGLIVCLARCLSRWGRQIEADSGKPSDSCDLLKDGRKRNWLRAPAFTRPTSGASSAANETSALIIS